MARCCHSGVSGRPAENTTAGALGGPAKKGIGGSLRGGRWLDGADWRAVFKCALRTLEADG
eukprot:13446556-Alexandrium_andersonii.AAC.1